SRPRLSTSVRVRRRTPPLAVAPISAKPIRLSQSRLPSMRWLVWEGMAEAPVKSACCAAQAAAPNRILPGGGLPASLRAMKLPTLPAWLLCLLLIGCALVDQTTFAPTSQAKTGVHPAATAVAGPPAGVEERRPLVTIGFAGPPPSYQSLLRPAVHAAETRDPTVQYDVIGP